MFPVSEKASKELLALPMFPELKREQQTYVIDTVREFLT